ncbi:TetR/AcrR family transcriptional regulator [Nocardioides daeguensis]|uniref:TetR family transcriptional regulator n=1 Tax=Nocardioides daeguensis TaxID=908359 RepID=A0ABP6USQ4_9ACTN|nr:TetR family transcriptional regulator [Nocardioides daeguensis]MBV6728632.1 TetR family transcriptional regulator [Nocardioides daeguensis]MCR1773759.1 TetR family transcriptional regulator [Nocardioides daeguensis]
MSAVAERRTAVFAALRALLLEQPWGEVTLEAVARDAGVSRQTLYNAFGSRYGLAQAYTVHLADALCALIAETLTAHPDDPRTGLEEGLRLFLETAAEDPLIDRVRAGDAHHDLVRIVTTDAGPLLVRVAGQLEAAARTAWPQADPALLPPLARTLARLALSYVSVPPEYDDSPAVIASGLSMLLTPR